jgi:hypothetical protein
MQHALGTPASEDETPDARRALSAAFHRLARLRAREDWSDGPATLLNWGNDDGGDMWGELPAPRPRRRQFDQADELSVAVAFTEDRLVQDETPLPLRGRFDEADIDTSWVALADAPQAEAPPPLPIALRLYDERLAESAPPATQAETAVEDDEPILGYGATPLLASLMAPIPVAETAPAPIAPQDGDDEPTLAYGSMPHWFDAPVDLAARAFANVHDVVALLAVEPAPAAPAAPPVEASQDDAMADIFIGAGPVAALLDLVPPYEPPLVLTRPFDPESLIDDALADAFDALIAPSPIAADDILWDADDALADRACALSLASCEAAMWGLPRHVPCSETFQANPNHETAVRLTRALRLRAHALEARAFAERADFGFLQSHDQASALWFMADALSDDEARADDADGLDASFPDWTLNDAGMIVVVAPHLAMTPAPAPTPVITEEELDALFAHVDDARRVVLDDLGDEPRWSEPYWTDVDSYLAHIAETMDPALLDAPPPYAEHSDIHDLDIRDSEPEPSADVGPERATHFWVAGDDADLVVDGEGDDLFIVAAGEDASVVLLEDGATWSMRTGGPARMDEVVVSLSSAPWSSIDAMPWRRIATLTGIGEIRIEQNAHATRRVMIAGLLAATGLEEDAVRLVQSTDDGEVAFPVERPLGDFEAFFAN